MHKLTASFWKSTKIGQKQGIKSSEQLNSLKCAITDFYDVYRFFYWLLTLVTEALSPL